MSSIDLVVSAVPADGGSFVGAFARGLRVLQALATSGPATMADVAKAAALDRAGARRLLLTLQQLGYVQVHGKRFALSPRVLGLGYGYLSTLPFWNTAQPVMAEVVQEVHETCSIGVLDADEVVFVLRVPARRLLSFDPSIGSRLPAYVHSIGRMLLAAATDEERDAYLARVSLQRFTPHTVASVAQLRDELEADRARGWSFVAEQYELGMCGIAMAVFDAAHRPVGAINVSLMHDTDARTRAEQDILPRLRLAARRVGG